MADLGYVKKLNGGIPDGKTRSILNQIWEHVLGNLRFGAPEHQTRATNFQSYWLNGTTPAEANQEFSIAHGLQETPRYAIPVLELDRENARTVALEVSRKADMRRIYLRSASTSASFLLLVE